MAQASKQPGFHQLPAPTWRGVGLRKHHKGHEPDGHQQAPAVQGGKAAGLPDLGQESKPAAIQGGDRASDG